MGRQVLDYSARIKTISDFVTQLNAQLLNAAGNGDGKNTSAVELILPEFLDRHVNLSLSSSSPSLEVQDRRKLDALGTKLWNTCTRLLRNGDDARVLAFCVLELAAGKEQEDGSDDIRLLKVALKTAKTCIGLEQLDLGLKVLEKAAIREESLSRSSDEDWEGFISRLSSEYFLLRISLHPTMKAWKQNRLDLAEHMFSKVSLDNLQQNTTSIEHLADLLYEIGRGLVTKKEYPSAEKWLTRASEVLSQSVSSQLGQDAPELRFCILHGLVRAKLAQQEEPDEETRDLLSVLQRDYEHALPILLLTLDVICKQCRPDIQEYYDCLCTIIETVPVIESNFKMIIGHLHQLKNWDAELATRALEQFVLQRLAPQQDTGLLERGIVTFIWMNTSSPNTTDGLEPLLSMVTRLDDKWGIRISAEATHASLILIWKRVGNAFGQTEYGVAEKWCRLAQHPVFEHAGETNKSKFQRKLIMCALESRNFQVARQTFFQTSESCKADPLTRYLMYRVALQADDIALARDCLEALCKQSAEASTYLLACAAEAQQSGMKHQAAAVLQQLVDNLDGKSLHGIHLPALLRCTARLLIGEITGDQTANFTIVEQVCRVFESFHNAATQQQLDSGQMSVDELEWFSRNSYNLALQNCTTWEPQHVLRFLKSCIKIIDLYPLDIGPEASSDITLRRLFCDFLGGIITVAQARMDEDHEVQRDHYLDSRLHIQSFRATFQSQLNRSNEKAHAELRDKYVTLLAFDFEASVRLGQWNSLSEIVEESREVGDEKLYGVFVDALLCSGAPVYEVSQVFQMILRVVREKSTQKNSKISRWLRCLFQLALGSDTHIAEEVLEHAYTLARDTPKTKTLSDGTISGYPQEELEWLSTTAFNRAIDFYLASDDAASKRWCAKALDIAQLMNDNGTLCNVLQRKFSCLKWEN